MVALGRKLQIKIEWGILFVSTVCSIISYGAGFIKDKKVMLASHHCRSFLENVRTCSAHSS